MSNSKRKLRIYTDTSVIGGCFDSEFRKQSLRFMDYARRGELLLLLSAVVIEELENAPPRVRAILTDLPPACVESVPMTSDVTRLRDAYLAAGIVAQEWTDDATHVALASVTRADAIVSWNFKHIVRLDKIKAYNRINVAHGYPELSIATPQVVNHEIQDRL